MRRAVFLLAAALAAAGCSKKDEGGARTTDAYVFPPVDVQRSFIAMMENPRAGNVLLVGEGAEKCAAFGERLKAASSLPLTLWDERRTTVEAHAILFGNGKNGRQRKKVVDAVAASLMLEGYMTRKRREAQ